MSLRWRLTLFYGLISALLLLVAGLALWWSLRLSLYRLLDQSLEQASRSVFRRFDGDGRGPHPDVRAPDGRPRLPGDTVLSVFGPGGQALGDLDLSPVSAPLEPGVRTVAGYRVLGVPLRNGYWIQAARSEAEALGALKRTQELLMLGLPVLFLLGLGGGYVLADRVLRPVDAVSNLAARIAQGGQPGERVPESPAQDEIGRLTRTVNAMLGKLEHSLAQERAFALAAAHELRTPLSILQSRVDLSLERERSVAHYREALQTVGVTTQQLTRLVEGLLTLARSQGPAGRLRCDLADLALEACEGHQAEAKARGQRIELELQSAPSLGDPDALRLALSNLLRNAIRYGIQGGRIWVCSRLEDTRAVFELRDDGPGIEPEELERLRRPFQRGQGLQAVQGSGLGLALVNAVAEQHAGTLELGRAPEGGLLARLVLPT